MPVGFERSKGTVKTWVALLCLASFGSVWAREPLCSPRLETQEHGLTQREQAALRTIARRAIASAVRGEALPHFAVFSKRLEERRGVFVTLKKGGRLRGCIGCLTASTPLYLTVERMAIQAGTSDPRFPPLGKDELDDLEIEISVLGPLKPLEGVDEIVIGKHGVFILQGRHRGVLLPQVALENGWDRETLLEHLSRKAGLPVDAWRSEKSRIYLFTAQVF
ncbi:MAG: AmmeMemoRadiSam system protein A [Deltaproteobacteria bacterium]|nr:AmmeMemoRadiSam system protein A [Deltaproteobacteria bacterium]